MKESASGPGAFVATWRAVRATMFAVTRQESDTELAGQLAASLTPRIQAMRPMPLQQRGEQNSGLFDIGAMYAASVEQVMRRAQRARKPAMGVVAAPPSIAAPYVAQAAQAQHGYAEYAREPAEVYEDVDLAGEYVVIAGLPRSGRIGRFAVAVAWLATATLAAAISTLVPAHGLKKEVAPLVAAPAPAPVIAPSPEPAIATVSLSALPSAGPTAAIAPIAAAAPTPATPTVTAASAPAANPNVTASLPHPRPAAPAHPRAAAHASAADAAPASVAKGAAASPADSPPATLKVAPTKPAAAAAPAAPASGGSLEDLIRQAVAAEAKKPH